MNGAHFHLLVNHLPIVIPIVGFFVLISGLISRSAAVIRTSFLIFVLGAICTVPAFASGEGAEEVVEHMQGVEEKFIHAHEETAETFAILSYLLGALSLFGFWASLKQKQFTTIVTYVILVFSVVTLFFAMQTGKSGGEVRHTEIREGADTTINE